MNTQTIELVKDYQCYDISEIPKAERLLERLDIKYSNVKLDLRNCMIDYPATSMIIDEILNKMEIIDTKRTFNIIIDFVFPQNTILNALFSGSKYFSLEDSLIESKYNIESKILQKVKEKNLVISITVFDLKGNPISEYRYE